MNSQLNIADKAIIVDLIIEASKKCTSIVIIQSYLELINRVKALEPAPLPQCTTTNMELLAQLNN